MHAAADLSAVPGPYSLHAREKADWLLPRLNELTAHHYAHCTAYRRILDSMFGGCHSADSIDQVPFLPVSLFKLQALKSVSDDAVARVMTSSGTTGQAVSRIFLDRDTSTLQTRALASIVTDFVGKARRPMVIVDNRSPVGAADAIGARIAGILGFANFGRDHFWLLDGQLRPDLDGLQAYLARHRGTPILLFGFTFVVWKHLLRAVEESGEQVDFGEGSLLIHGGGWKRLEAERIDNDAFKERLRKSLGIRHVANYYGMVEQVGSVYMECEHGRLHTPVFSDVLVRDPDSFRALPAGATGLLQVVSSLPRSYPGHALLTEDLGTVNGEDNCPCGRPGRHFSVHGRLPAAELRGCSDVRAV